MLIGVTGQIGAGKSAVVAALSRRGALVVDADKVGKQVTGSPAVLAKLVKVWGESLRTKSGKLRPAALAEIVFGDQSGSRLERFNELIREPLGRAIRDEIRQAEKKASRCGKPVPVVLDAALLPDWDIAEKMKLIVLVTATRRIRLKRLVARGMAEADALARMRRQSPLRIYRNIADVTLTNNGSLELLEEKVDLLWQKRIVPSL